ncbi:sulfurtransferase TusA family protein [Devosia sp. CAU 1758]
MAIDDGIIDARGLKCPLPVLKLEKHLASAEAGAVITVLATDPMARIDIPLHCRQNGHGCTQIDADGVMRFVVTKSVAKSG